jgi:hypothetical protein
MEATMAGKVLNDLTAKPTYDELLAMLQAEKAKNATPTTGKVEFGQSEKNPKFFIFKHGLAAEAWPVSTTPKVWRVILANVKLIEAKLPK